MTSTTLDWSSGPMARFRSIARWEHEQASAAYGDGAIAQFDQAVMTARDKLAEAGIDSRDAVQVYYFILGAQAQWSAQLMHAVVSCKSPDSCLRGVIAHSANANLSWRPILRAIVNALPGLPEEPEAVPPTEYQL